MLLDTHINVFILKIILCLRNVGDGTMMVTQYTSMFALLLLPVKTFMRYFRIK